MADLSARQLKELQYLLEAAGPQPAAEVARALGVKERTLRADLPALESYCAERGLLIPRGRRQGLVLQGAPEARGRLRDDLAAAVAGGGTTLGSHDRRRRMVVRFLLSPELPTLDQWCEEFGVSRPSIVKDIKAVKEWLAERRLALVGKSGVGYSLVAREFDLRNAVVQYLIQGNEVNLTDAASWPDGHQVLGDFDFAAVRRFLDDLQREAKVELIEPDYAALALYVAVTVARLRDGKRVPDDLGDLQTLLGTSEYRLVAGHVPDVEKAYGVKFSAAEETHLTLSFICAKKIQPRSSIDASAVGDEAGRLANEVAHDAEEVFGVPLGKDEDFLRLLATHIGVTLRKLRFGLPLEPEGPTEEIKRQHPLAFGVGLMFTERLSQRLGRRVPVLEATYVAMHVAAGLEKVKYRLQRRKRVALVCTTALSASTLLFWQLTNLLPQVDVVQVGTYEDVVKGRITAQVDLIVSTVPLPPLDAPVLVISPLFAADDRRRILAAIQTKPERDLIHRTAAKLLTPETTLLNQAHADSHRLLTDVGQFLVKRGYAKRGFVKALLEREAQFGSALNMPVPLAMPHAGPAYTRKTAVALITLQKAIPFRLVESPAKELRVRLVIIPLLTLDDVTGMRFYELLTALRRKKLGRAIIEAADPDEVIRLVAGALGGAGRDGKGAPT